MTLLKENLGTEFGDVQFGVQKSYRYHTTRQKHYERLSQSITFCIIVVSALWGIVLLKLPDTSRYAFAGPAELRLSALDIVLTPSAMGAVHST